MGIKLSNKSKRNEVISVPFAPIKRAIPKWRWFVILLIVTVPLAYFLYQLVTQAFFQDASGYVAFDTVEIRAPGNGYVEKLFVEKSQPVKKNSLLLEFKSPEIKAQKDGYNKELAKLRHIVASQNNNELNELKLLLEEAKHDMLVSKEYYKTFQEYLKKGSVNIIDMEKARKDLSLSKQKIVEIKAKIELSKSTHEQMIEREYLSKIRALNTKIEELKVRESNFNIYSPITGTVNQVNTHTQEYVTNGFVLLTLVTNKNLHFVGFVDAKQARYVKKNKTVTIIFPDKERVEGIITHIPTFAERNPTELVDPFRHSNNKIIIIVSPLQPVPERFHVHGVPVSIDVT